MVRRRPIPLVTFLLALTSVCLIASSAFGGDQPQWIEIHSTHFTVITDAGDKRGREVALRFEQMRTAFASLLNKDRLNQPQPVTIFAFKDDKDYYQLAPLRQGQPIDAPGFLITGEDQDFIALNLSQPEPWRAVARDFGQLLLNYNYPPAQAWFDAGLTEYFSSVRVDNKQGEMGADPELLPPVAGGANATKSFTDLLNAQPWLPITELFASQREGSADVAATRHTIFAAQSWIVMHYLIDQKKLPETGAYLGAILIQHATVDQAIQQAFSMTTAQLDQAVKDYFHSQVPPNSIHVDHFPAPVGPDDSAITVKSLSNSNARAMYGEVQIRIPERRDAGVKELQSLASLTPAQASPSATQAKAKAKAKDNAAKDNDKDNEKDPDDNSSALATGNEIAHRGLAWDHLQRNEFEEALTELGDAAAINQGDMWIRYYLSLLKYRMSETKRGEIQGLANMIQDLRGVLEWYPEFADAYDLMAIARMQGGGSTGAMQAERAAMQLSPRNERYIYHQAQIYIAGKQWEAAKALLERLQAGGDPKLAAESREKLEQVATERKYGIPTASGPAPAKLETQKSPFDVLEQDAAQRAAAEQQSAQSGGAADKRAPKFIKAHLVRIDCSKAPVAIVTVTAGGTSLKLRTPDYKSLLLIGADDFSCDWRDRAVTVNYKPGGTVDGDLVSLELR